TTQNSGSSGESSSGHTRRRNWPRESASRSGSSKTQTDYLRSGRKTRQWEQTGLNYAHEFREVDGIMVAMQRRVYSFDTDKRKIAEPVLVAIDIHDIAFMARMGGT